MTSTQASALIAAIEDGLSRSKGSGEHDGPEFEGPELQFEEEEEEAT